jgi:hypothetical protein
MKNPAQILNGGGFLRNFQLLSMPLSVLDWDSLTESQTVSPLLNLSSVGNVNQFQTSFSALRTIDIPIIFRGRGAAEDRWSARAFAPTASITTNPFLKVYSKIAVSSQEFVLQAEAGTILGTPELLDYSDSDGDSHDGDDFLDGFPPVDLQQIQQLEGQQTVGKSALMSLSNAFLLHSNPFASKTIYLDFDGHVIPANSAWANSNNGGNAIDAPAWSLDGDSSTFNDTELARIQNIWQRVAEDFAPFDVDVTTELRGESYLTRSSESDEIYGTRVLISPISSYFGNYGGIAYVGVFNYVDVGDYYKPALVFPEKLANGEKYIAEAISHEAGHNLGLLHDGTSSQGYYSGHGSAATGWAAIMGVGYYKELTQWSKGEYPDANNQEDDLAIITTQNGFGYRSDDAGSTAAAANNLGILATNAANNNLLDVSQFGIIESNTDRDWFKFTTGNGAINLTIQSATRAFINNGGTFTTEYLISPSGGTNLDIWAGIYATDGTTLVAQSNPVDALSANFTNLSLNAGAYYLAIDGVGKGDLITGYSDYGSLGQYLISGTLVQTPASIGDSVWQDLNANGIQDANEPGINGATVKLLDSNGNAIATTTTGDNPNTPAVEQGYYNFSNLTPGTYSVMFVQPNGFNNVSPFQQGGNPAVDSNANPGNNLTSNPVTLISGESNNSIDAGFYKTGIQIVKTAGNAPDGTTLIVNSSGNVTFNYKVSNPGNVSLSNITPRDDNGTPGNTGDDFNPPPVISGGFNTGDINQNNLLDAGEMWQYRATRNLNFDTEIYAYAYQQITNLQISGLSTPLVQPNTSAGSSLLTFNSSPPGQITNLYDVNESFVSSTSNLGEGNNTGFFSGNPIPDSDKGKVNADYSRGDAVVSSSNTTPVPITNAGQLQNLLGGGGVNGAGVAESYLDKSVNTLFQTSPKNYYKDEGNGNGEWSITSIPFTVASDTPIQFNYDYLNKLIVEVDPTTPPGALQLSLARAQVGFEIQINYTLSGDGSTEVLFLHKPAVTNKDISLSTTSARTETALATGFQQVATQLLRDLDGDNIEDPYTIVIRGRNLVNTRLVLEDKLTRTNIATVTGTLVGVGSTIQETNAATVAVNTIPQSALMGSAMTPNNSLLLSNEPMGAMIAGTEALVPSTSGII